MALTVARPLVFGRQAAAPTDAAIGKKGHFPGG
jgi:hypothetical protein